jgi:2-dehydropantoate 2-reductase
LDLVAEESERIVAKAGISLAYPDIKSKVYAVCEGTAQNTSSMLQDILRGKRTEIDAINGAIVEKAKALNINAPVNEMLTCLVKVIEARGLEGKPECGMRSAE